MSTLPLCFSGRFLRRNIFEKYLSKFFADKYFSAARFGKYGKRLTVQKFIFLVLWRDLKGFRLGVTGGRKKGNFFCLCNSNTVPCLLLFHARSAYYVHETEEIYTPTQLNLAKLTKEPSATDQIRLWSQRGTKVNRPHHVTSCCVHHHGSESRPKNQPVTCTNPATCLSLCI